MPVDAQALEAAIAEASAGDAEIAGWLREKYAKNEQAAAAFVGGFTRTADYTRKTQGLADERKKLEQQLSLYQTNLEAAEADKAKVLKELANQKITVAQANARLQGLKETYQLSDDDIPPMGDLIDTRKTGKPYDSTADIDERLAAFAQQFEEKITKTLLPELAGMTDLDIIWANMRDEHHELTGKRLTAAEQREILKTARDNGRKLIDVWEEKFDIPGARKKVERESIVKEERAKWEAEQTAKRSAEALEGIRPGTDETGLRLSPVLKRQFKERGDPAVVTNEQDKPVGRTVISIKSGVERESLTGAERAAKAYLERRAAGIPLGQKESKSA